MQIGLIYTETASRVVEKARKRRKENGMAGSGMEDSKKKRGDKGEQTHAKPPPTAAGDPGSVPRAPPPLEEGRGATNSGRGQRGARQGSVQDSTSDPADTGCQGRGVYSTVGLGGSGVPGNP